MVSLTCFGSSVSGGTSPYAYQWYLNGVAVSGATSATWTFTPGSHGSFGVYVNVTDNAGFRAKSNIASATVNPVRAARAALTHSARTSPPNIYSELIENIASETEVLTHWTVDRVVHFGPKDLLKNGQSHFGFHDRNGKHYAIFHQKHFLGLVGREGQLEWTVAAHQMLPRVHNITAKLNYPMYIDNLDDGTIIISNFGDGQVFRINVEEMKAERLIDGLKIGMKDCGNCVVDNENTIWINEVVGCKIWRFSPTGKPILTLGDGTSGFESGTVDFSNAKFSWIYDIRRGPDGNIYVLDSRNFSVRMIDLKRQKVHTLAGAGKPGYEGDNGDALNATFGSDPNAKFDGPISLSLDEEGNIYVGDRMNHVVRMIKKKTAMITTIAGNHLSIKGKSNNLKEKDPFKLNLPEISSMDYHEGRLYVPTDITPEEGDLTILKRGKQ